ncbi:major facilitator superfamily domain-containing protein [Crucibulum laeve]|uniref:Major facilitator superfamily domain-containing protein n=1 Tax=Crucibulum laeve TaxID=68775 RepID=A0A5C3LZ90_9AGAR|nr:major facilitator superfamily domain-containing protein [Crucibulum laeve]
MELDVLSSSSGKNQVEGSIRSVARSHRLDNRVEDQSTDGAINNNTIEEEFIQTREQVYWARVQFLTLCWTLFLAGWNDGSTGPLLPRIQEVYHVGFALVSLIFVFACVGFLCGAFLNVWFTDKIPFGKFIVFGSIMQVIAYAIQSPALPFPAFVAAFTINGIGLSIQDAQANGFVGSLKQNAETKMGVLHAAYGLGAFAAPLVATQFSQLRHWSFHYLVSLGIAISNTIILAMVFRFKSQDHCLSQIGQEAGEKGTSEHSAFRQILSLKAVHLLAFFILVYVGVEVTIGGWIVTYIIDVRGGGPNSGYISSGFFGGLTAGRVALLWVNKKVGERRVLFIYAVIAIALQLVVWLVPSLIGGAVSVSLVGVLLGPMYPIAMNQASRILPGWLLTGSIGWIAGFGQAGSAVLPFMTGAISSKHGIKSLQPLVVAMMAFMMILWALVPRKASKLSD